MDGKEALGVVDLKALVERANLGISHFTAQKYLIAIYIPLDTAQNLESKLGPAMVKQVGKLAQKRPELAMLLKSAGLSRLRKAG